MSTDSSRAPERVAWAASFAHRGFRLFQAARFLSILGVQMQGVAIGWQVYSITGRPMALAWVGLAQFLPAVGLSLVTGHVADRVDRRKVLILCHCAMATLSMALLIVTRSGMTLAWPIYLLLVGVGAARAFLGPANQSLLPTLVPVAHFGNAVAWGSTFWQVATVLGPMVGGLVYAAFGGPSAVYGIAAMVALAAMGLSAALSAQGAPGRNSPTTRATLFAGIRYVYNHPIVFGAVSLDLFAVLLGGATALLPVYARDILHLGPWALGVLRSAPAAGAALTAVALALRPIESHAGMKMFAGVAAFGAATIVFGLSRGFTLSLAALVVLGASDMVSVFVRSALVQLATPDAMRGRVSAVNMVFIGASNELGEFESGLTAQWLGTVPAVVLGGIGTLAVVAIWAWRFPALRRVRRLDEARVAEG